MSELECSYSSFHSDIGDKLEGENTVYGVKCGNREGLKCECLGTTYGTGDA